MVRPGQNEQEWPTAWVTGAGGLIGNYLVETAGNFAPRWRVVGLTRRDLDLLDYAAVRERFEQERPKLVIHCAALSRSPICQGNPELARKINVEATRLLAELCGGSRFVFFSTDLVFDGGKGMYLESDAVNPLSVYAETKVEAELAIRAHPDHITVRTSLNGGVSPTGDRGFNEEMRNAWKAGKEFNLFVDEFRSPIPAEVTAAAVWELAMSAAPGIYHVAGAERLSRFEIGQLLAERWPSLNPRYRAGSLKEYKGAPRPPDTSLDCSKAQQELTFPLPGLRDWLRMNPQKVF